MVCVQLCKMMCITNTFLKTVASIFGLVNLTLHIADLVMNDDLFIFTLLSFYYWSIWSIHGWAMIRKTKKKWKTIQRKTWGLSVGNDSITRNYLMRTARVGLVYNLHMHLHTLKILRKAFICCSLLWPTVKCLQLKYISFNPMLYIYRYIV